MVGSLTPRDGIELKYSYSIHEWRLSAYWGTGRGEFYAEETQHLSTLVNEEQKKRCLLHDTSMHTLRPLADAVSAFSEKEGLQKDKMNWFRTFLCYCSNIRDKKDISCVRHGMEIAWPCVKCQGDMYDITDLQESDIRQPRHTILRREEHNRMIWREERIDSKKG